MLGQIIPMRKKTLPVAPSPPKLNWGSKVAEMFAVWQYLYSAAVLGFGALEVSTMSFHSSCQTLLIDHG